jgi:hypothetical protein
VFGLPDVYTGKVLVAVPLEGPSRLIFFAAKPRLHRNPSSVSSFLFWLKKERIWRRFRNGGGDGSDSG